MHEELTFWIRIWSLGAFFMVFFIFCLTMSSIHTTNRVAEAIKMGVDPMAAKCALNMPQESGKLLCAYLGD